MASTSAVDKAALTAHITAARAALKGGGASEVTGTATGNKVATASVKAVRASAKGTVSVRHKRLRKIRLKV